MKKVSKAQQARDALAAWWRRYYWPCIILSADPGARAGATILRCTKYDREVLFVAGVDTNTTVLEDIVQMALEYAIESGLPLVLVVESWGAGGNRGINQWLGLGAARGAWIRAYELAIARGDVIKDAYGVNLLRPAIVRTVMSTWRKHMIEGSGTRDSEGKWQRYDAKEWKAAAQDACEIHFPELPRIEDTDAAESALQALYAARSDELAKALTKPHLKRYNLTFPPAPRAAVSTPKRRKRKR